jgi:hypothetical protein
LWVGHSAGHWPKWPKGAKVGRRIQRHFAGEELLWRKREISDKSRMDDTSEKLLIVFGGDMRVAAHLRRDAKDGMRKRLRLDYVAEMRRNYCYC